MKWKQASLQLLIYFLIPASLIAQAPGSTENFTVREGLSENVVHCLLQDKKGFIWIGTHEGLNRYDGYKFKKFQHNKNDSTSLPNSPVEEMFEDDEGNLLIKTTSGYARMNSLTGKFTAMKVGVADFAGIVRSFSGQQHNLLNFGLDRHWLYDKKNAGKKNLRPDLKKILLSYPSALDFYYDIHKRVWVLQQNKLIVIDESGIEKTIVDDFLIGYKKGIFNFLADDPNGNIWVYTPGKMFCLDKNSLEVKLVLDQSQVKELKIENISTLLLDRSGVLWLGSFYGLKKLNLSPQQFKHFVQNDGEKGLVSNFVLGLNLYFPNRITVQHFYADSFYTEIDLPSHTTNRFRLKENADEKLLKEVLIRNNTGTWTTKMTEQINRLKMMNYDWKTYRYAYSDREGVIWSFRRSEKLFNLYDERVINLQGEAEYLWDDESHLWIATNGNGLIRYNKTTGEIKCFKVDKNNKASISTNELICLAADAEENLWIGTRGGGLNYFDKEKETFIHYTQANGLSNNTIYCMVMDNENNLWMGTANGLSYFNTKAKSFQNFYTADGLINMEFNRWSAVKDAEGNLYFGGMHGIDYFKPADVLSQKNSNLVVQLTDFKTGNLSQTLQEGPRLHHKQNYISFDFAALDFRNPNGAQYKYMLQGANNEWIDNGHNHTATFAALRPGKYVFKVKGTTQNGLWSNEAAFPFTIKTPWWQTQWFYAVCGLVIAAILYGVYRFRINQIQKLYLVRSKISQDLHDEVGSGLSGISLLGHIARQQLNEKKIEEAANILNKISAYSDDMVTRVSDIVWSVNPQNENLDKMLTRLQSYASGVAGPQNIQFNFRNETTSLSKKVKMPVIKNLYLLCKEAVNNALKYSQCRTLNCFLISSNGYIELLIEDDGNGFDPGKITEGNGLLNMQKRAEELKTSLEIASKPGRGTKISLKMKIP
jgi:ligand-binding sensor domain-containing protein/two-component sensor histidine kinase